MELNYSKVSEWLIFIGKICAYATVLFAIELGFFFGLVSIILILSDRGHDVSNLAILPEIHWFLWKFAFLMFFLGVLFWMFQEIKKANKEKRARWERQREETIEEIKTDIMKSLGKSDYLDLTNIPQKQKLNKSRRKK